MISIDSSKKHGRDGGPGVPESGKKDDDGDDRALWNHVVQDVAPLPGKKSNTVKTAAPGVPVKTKPTPATPVLPTARKVAPSSVRTPGDREVDRRTDQKLKRGQYPVDLTLDLHGLTQAAAHNKLVQTLQSGYARGLRCVLVITGKGRAGPGVLRQRVPEWLMEESMRGVVLRFHKAQPGDGALYVLLKRKRSIEPV